MLRKILLLVSVFLITATTLLADPSSYEVKLIRAQVVSSFRLMMDTWKEELYFEMYDLGQWESQKKISLEEFAQRMVDLQWKPSLKPETIDSLDVLYRNYTIIHSTIQFEHKVNPTRILFKKISFPVILEDQGWKFDLTTLIRTPYPGKEVKPEKKKAKKEKKEGSKTVGNEKNEKK